ncbi:MAG: hypothetical protein J6T24_02015, partial [Clostridia bacterium]|nr:hypothetical protein [Clostridia bacterium]
MKLQDIILPVAVTVRVDDVGWFEGEDGRYGNRPARSGIPRRHVPDDFRVLHEIGKGLNTKILCNLVLGDWDIKNRLRGVPHLTWDEAGWDAAKTVNANRAHFDEVFDILEGSEYLEYGLHSLEHGYFVDGKHIDGKHYYPLRAKNERGETVREAITPEELDTIFSLFFEIYNDWGFKKKIKVFAAPCGAYGQPTDDFNRALARAMRHHGIGVWQYGGWAGECVVEDMIFLRSAMGFITWNAFGIDPAYFPNVFEDARNRGFTPNFIAHLTNFIQFQPEKNFDYVSAWVDYLRRITSPFGALIGRDNEQSASQAVYTAYAGLDTVDGGYRID